MGIKSFLIIVLSLGDAPSSIPTCLCRRLFLPCRVLLPIVSVIRLLKTAALGVVLFWGLFSVSLTSAFIFFPLIFFGFILLFFFWFQKWTVWFAPL